MWVQVQIKTVTYRTLWCSNISASYIHTIMLFCDVGINKENMSKLLRYCTWQKYAHDYLYLINIFINTWNQLLLIHLILLPCQTMHTTLYTVYTVYKISITLKHKYIDSKHVEQNKNKKKTQENHPANYFPSNKRSVSTFFVNSPSGSLEL